MAGGFCARHGYGFECLADASQRAYRAYSLGRGGVREVFGPEAALAAGRATLQGHVIGRPSGDVWQLAGVFLVDRGGVVRYAHRNQRADDHPRSDELLRTFDQVMR